ncbi:MAG: 1-phosphofructokinase [Armatimonadota bacterium]
MITTVTINPAFDKTIYVYGLKVGDTNRVEKTEVDAGGKGINASRMLAELGAETAALGFVGGRTGRFIETVLNEDGIKSDFVHTKAETRTNIAIEDLGGVPPTTINEKGGPITPEELEHLKEKVKHWAKKSRIMVFGGSIPLEVEPAVYRDLAHIAQAEGAKVILDADNKALELGIEAHPMMIKPNLDEAERLCGRALKDVSDVADAAMSLVNNQGLEVVVVSMGSRGAIAATHGEVWQAIPPEVEAISTVGSGDSMVAGIAIALADRKPLSEGLALGTAAGAATAMSSGVEMGKKEDVDRLLPKVVLKRI